MIGGFTAFLATCIWMLTHEDGPNHAPVSKGFALPVDVANNITVGAGAGAFGDPGSSLLVVFATRIPCAWARDRGCVREVLLPCNSGIRVG